MMYCDDESDMVSTWSHRLWLASGCMMVLISLAKSVVAAATARIWFGPVVAGFAGYVLADLITG